MWADDLGLSYPVAGVSLANAKRTEGLSDLAYCGGEAVLC
jgi:hypothetical protein